MAHLHCVYVYCLYTYDYITLYQCKHGVVCYIFISIYIMVLLTYPRYKHQRPTRDKRGSSTRKDIDAIRGCGRLVVCDADLDQTLYLII